MHSLSVPRPEAQCEGVCRDMIPLKTLEKGVPYFLQLRRASFQSLPLSPPSLFLTVSPSCSSYTNSSHWIYILIIRSLHLQKPCFPVRITAPEAIAGPMFWEETILEQVLSQPAMRLGIQQL